MATSLAIIAVVINHASSTWVVGGGANLLLLLFGLNFRRYSGRSLSDGVSLTPLRNFFVRVVLPYYALLRHPIFEPRLANTYVLTRACSEDARLT